MPDFTARIEELEAKLAATNAARDTAAADFEDRLIDLGSSKDEELTSAGRRIADLETRLAAETSRADTMYKAIGEVLGAQHVLRYAFGFVRKWKDDPKLNVVDECARIEKHIGEWHERLVAARKA